MPPAVAVAEQPVTLPPFSVFLDEHREDIYRFLHSSVGPAEADDCFQETVIAALRAYPRLGPGSNLKAWALTIAHRKAIDSHRSRARRAVPSDTIEEMAGAAPPVATGLGGDADLWSLVLELPPKQRGAVLLRFVQDFAFAEVGEVLGCSEDAARRSVHEGLKRLREDWTP